ncbi:MAG TPA: class I SAM-dependent methyltransferase [Candidatus Saccharimonadales bacterium]|nr:class I SAM-dependent methyltransferase [Candidatus Saccharimonadales bacterium]
MAEINGGEVRSDYASLAPHYDPVYDAGYSNRVGEIAIVRGLVGSFKPEAQSLLELGTGTGAILKGFEGLVDELVGLDLSPEMLEQARKNVPAAEFVEGDMSEFELDRKFDVIVCLFDSINHLRNFEEWENTFRRTQQHLDESGIFIFDVATPGLVQGLAEGDKPKSWPIDGGTYSVTIEQMDDNHYVARFKLAMDQPDGSVAEIAAGSIYETVYPIEDIKAAAGEHFELLLDFEAVNILVDKKLEPATDNSRHPIFVYEKRQ